MLFTCKSDNESNVIGYDVLPNLMNIHDNIGELKVSQSHKNEPTKLIDERNMVNMSLELKTTSNNTKSTLFSTSVSMIS